MLDKGKSPKESVKKLQNEKVENPKIEKETVKKETVKKEENVKVEEAKVEKAQETADYSKMTLAELKAIAKEQGLKGYSTMKKDELLSNLK